MANTTSAMRNNIETLQPAGSTTGSGNILAIPPSFVYHNIYITGSAGVAAGAIQVESSDDPNYAGTWVPVGGGPITIVASKKVGVNFTGAYQFIRAGISTPVAGGTVQVTYEGHP
jgi:hypothetical protein